MAETDAPCILILRLSALGDVAMASPLIDALRRRYPRAYIGWLAQPEVAPVLKAHPGLDALITWPRQRLASLARTGRLWTLQRELRQFVRELRRHRFDWALDPQGLMKSGLLAYLSGAGRRVGVGSEEGSRWLMTERLALDEDRSRISSEYRQLAAYLGLPIEGDFAMHVAVDPEDRDWAARALTESGLDGGFVALLPFTTRPQKHWFEDRWAELARQLHQAGQATLILGGPGDHDAACRIQAAAGCPTLHQWAGQTSIGQAIALLARARGAVGVDTGLTHIALAHQVPTVCLFGSTVPYRDAGPHPAAILYRALPCSPCQRNPICGGVFHCMRQILPAEVMRALRQIGGMPIGEAPAASAPPAHPTPSTAR
jgi:heptosyltransferase-1